MRKSFAKQNHCWLDESVAHYTAWDPLQVGTRTWPQNTQDIEKTLTIRASTYMPTLVKTNTHTCSPWPFLPWQLHPHVQHIQHNVRIGCPRGLASHVLRSILYQTRGHQCSVMIQMKEIIHKYIVHISKKICSKAFPIPIRELPEYIFDAIYPFQPIIVRTNAPKSVLDAYFGHKTIRE